MAALISRHVMGRRGFASSAAITAAAIAAVLLLASTPVTGAPAASNAIPLVGTICNPPNPNPILNRTPASLDISNVLPHAGGVYGNLLNVSLEYKVQGYVHADKHIQLYVPSVKAVLPTSSPAGSLSVTLPPVTEIIEARGWSAPTAIGGSRLITSNVTFAKGSASYLTTSKSAIMATAAYGNLTIEFRWRWTIFDPANGRLRTAPWSLPSLNASYPYLPSIFYPAPYVGLVSTTPQPVNTGTTFVVELNGSVANTSFRLVLEYPNNGTNIQSIWENTTPQAKTFNATVPLSFTNGTAIPAGTYLVHVHDHCQAIVHMVSVVVVLTGGHLPAGGQSVAPAARIADDS